MWGQRPLLTRAAELPRDYSDLLSPGMVDEIMRREQPETEPACDAAELRQPMAAR